MIFAMSSSKTSEDKLPNINGVDADEDRQEPYRLDTAEVLARFHVDARSGLSAAEAKERLKRYGTNELAVQKPVPAWRKFLAQFTDILVILLLVAGLVSTGLWLYEREAALPYEALAILGIVLLNAVMGYVQQARAEQAVAALRKMSAARPNVVHDATLQSIPAAELVPGDVNLKKATPSRPTRG